MVDDARRLALDSTQDEVQISSRGARTILVLGKEAEMEPLAVLSNLGFHVVRSTILDGSADDAPQASLHPPEQQFFVVTLCPDGASAASGAGKNSPRCELLRRPDPSVSFLFDLVHAKVFTCTTHTPPLNKHADPERLDRAIVAKGWRHACKNAKNLRQRNGYVRPSRSGLVATHFAFNTPMATER